MSDKIEERLQLLEEKFEYQDQLVEALNQVVIEQQKTIDSLEQRIEVLKEELSSATQTMEDVNEPPPHY